MDQLAEQFARADTFEARTRRSERAGEHCLRRTICYRERVSRLMFLAMLFALIIPRMAWAAHISGDDQPRPASVSHVHHDDHSHVVNDAEDDRSRESDSSESHGSLAHNHLAADVLSVMSEGDSSLAEIDFSFARSTHSLDRRSDRPPTEAPDSLLRPPRTA